MIAEVSLSVALPARAEKEIATAGTGNPTLTTGDAPDSICPSGWRLPSEYANLIKLLNSRLARETANIDTVITIAPFNSPRAGLYDGNVKSGGSSFYWPSNSAKHLYSNGTYLIDTMTLTRNYGMALRCLAR